MTAGYYYRCPTTILTGPGVAAEVGQQAKTLNASRVLIVTDPGVAKTPHMRTVTDSLASSAIAYEVLDRVEPDPAIEVVEDNVGVVVAGRFDAIVALGGGSSIDVAKGLRLLGQFGGSLRDYAPGNKVPRPLAIPLIAISTTAGTGSQVSFGAVFSDKQRGTKFTISSPNLAPTLALNDPLVTMGAPAMVTATAGMDALGHAIESYLSARANPYTEIWSLEAVRLVSRNLPRVMKDGEDLAARDAMLLASTIAIVSATNCGLGADHALAMPLCTLFELPHGLVIGMMLASVMEYNLEASATRLAQVAAAMGVDISGMAESTAGVKAIEAVRTLADEVGLPRRLRDVGVKEEMIPLIAELAMQSFQVPNNPREMTSQSVEAMLRRAY